MKKRVTKKKKLTKNQIAFAKQIKRIKQFIKRAEKRGYDFPDYVLPEKPQRITKKTLEKLESLTPENLYKKATYGGEATYGEKVTGTEGLKAERKARAKKAAETRKRRKQEQTSTPTFEPPYNPSYDTDFYDRTIISGWKTNLQNYANGEAYNLLQYWLNDVITTNGVHNTAIMLEEGANSGNIIQFDIAYKHDKAMSYIGAMLDYLPDQGIIYKDEVLDKLQYMARLSDAFEEDEDWGSPS